MRKLLLATTALIALAAVTPAKALTWDFGEHGFGALPSVQQFDTGGFFLSARGFDGSDAPRALFSKNGGGNEVGLGLAGLLDNEILGGNFVQLNLDGIRSRLTNLTFSMNSVDNTEGWVVYGSNDNHPFQFTQLAHSTGLADEGVHSLADGYDNYNFFFSPSGFGGEPGGSNVLLASFGAQVQAAVPEASTWAMMILGFCGVGLFSLRQRGRMRFA